jgi:hypothetical protein
MCHQYGCYSSWLLATKAFGKILHDLPENMPVKIWPIAAVILGEDNPKWTKDMVKQFQNQDAVEIAIQGNCIQENRYYIHPEIIDELGLD